MRRMLFAAAAGLAIALVGWSGPAQALVVGPFRATGPTPYPANCNRTPQPGTVFTSSEVEPFVGVNPTRHRNVIGVYQQDRWSNGGAQGVRARFSTDGGVTWADSVNPPFSQCAGGNPRNGGDYERATDPWVSFAPNGDAYFNALNFNANDPVNAVTVAKSRDGGRVWGPVTTLIRDTDPRAFNDKNSLTADPTDARLVYSVWDRLFQPDLGQPDFFGPTYLARTTNGGASWEPARAIFDPGLNNQTIGNVISVLPDGTVINSFNLILGNNLNVALIRSTDHGATWSTAPIFVDQLGTIGVVDPRDGAPVRTGDILPSLATDPRPGTANVYAVWQDARFSGGQNDQIAFSRSGDGGRTWTPPVRVSPPGAVQAFTASVAVDSSGEIAVGYYDFTFTRATGPLATDYWVTRSRDGGRTFGPRERVTNRSFDMRRAPVAGGFFVGDYTGLVAAGRRFTAFYTATTATDPGNCFSARILGPPRTAATGDELAEIAAPRRSNRAPGRLATTGPVTTR